MDTLNLKKYFLESMPESNYNAYNLPQMNVLKEDVLHRAIWMGHLDEVKRLLAVGFPVNQLLAMDALLRFTIVNAFQKHDIYDIGTTEDWILTGLHVAAMTGNLDMIRLLVLWGADVEARSYNGVTPLILAIVFGNDDTAETLLKCGAQVDTPTFSGRTALHYAVEVNQLRVINLLLQHGAKVHAYDMANKTPLFLAVDRKLENVVKTLAKYAAKDGDDEQEKLNVLHYVILESRTYDILESLMNYNAKYAELLMAEDGPLNLNSLLVCSDENVRRKILEIVERYRSAFNC